MFPSIEIDLRKVQENTRTVVQLCEENQIIVTGVTKAVCGDPRIAKAIIKGGVSQLGDSRISNIIRMRNAGIKNEIILLRSPGPSIINNVVEYVDVSMVSEIRTLKMLNTAASIREDHHGVILMVDIGDRREGVLPNKLEELVTTANDLEYIEIRGIGTNVACFGGIIPTEKKMKDFSTMVMKLEGKTGLEFEIISGGNSANLPLLLNGNGMHRVNHLRIGEGILLGLETVTRSPIPDTHQDAFTIHAELVESKKKPSLPDGEIGQDAFGNIPQLEDRGIIHEGLLALGRQDIAPDSLHPLDPAIEVLGANSDYVVADLGRNVMKIGDEVGFIPGYGSLLRVMTSPYVEHVYLEW